MALSNIDNLYELIMHVFEKLNIVEDVANFVNYDLLNRDKHKPGVKCKFTDLQVLALAIIMNLTNPNNENDLYRTLANNQVKIPHLIKRRQFNHRLKRLGNIISVVQSKISEELSKQNKSNYWVVDSTPLPASKLFRANKMEE